VLVISTETFNSGSTTCSAQSTISDTDGNAWSPAISLSTPVGAFFECVSSAISYAPITTGGGADTITVTFSGSPSWVALQYQEISGVSTSGVVTTSGSASQSNCATGLTSFSLTSQSFVPGSVLVGSYATDYQKGPYAAPTAGSTFTTQVDSHVYEGFDEYSTTASSPNTWPASNASGACLWTGVGAAFATAAPFALQVPQFPVGLSLLLALALPAMVIMRSRVLRSKTT